MTGPPRVLRGLNAWPLTNVLPFQLQWLRCSMLPLSQAPLSVLLPPKSQPLVTAPMMLAYWRQPLGSFHCQPARTCVFTTSAPFRKPRSLLSNPGEMAPNPALNRILPCCLLSHHRVPQPPS